MYKVLIAEDEPIVRLGLKNMLDWGSLGMVVAAQAADGEMAWKLYCEEQPDIVLTDIRMPVLDGMEFIRRIRRTHAKTKVIILTCIEDIHMIQEALELGATGYILKLTAEMSEITRLLEKAKKELDEECALQELYRWMDIELIKQQMWDSFVTGRSMEVQEFEEFAEKVHLRVQKDTLRLIVFRISEKAPVQSIEKQEAVRRRQYVRDLVVNLLDRYPYGECIAAGENEFCILLSPPEDSEDYAEEIVKAVERVLSQNIGVSVQYGISSEGAGYEALPMLYGQVLQNLEGQGEEGKAIPQRMQQALICVQQGFADNTMSLQSVADQVGVSANHLSRMFSKHLNISFVHYLNRVRIEKARELLCNPALKVHEVGNMVGFYSIGYFTRVFKSMVGQTPAEFRNGGKEV